MNDKRPLPFCSLAILLLQLTFSIHSAHAQNPEFPKPSIPKPTLPKPPVVKPPVTRQDLPKPPVPRNPNVNIPRPPVPNPNTPRNNAPAKPQYNFIAYPNHRTDANGVVHVPMIQSNYQYRMYPWTNIASPKDPMLLKSGALDTLAALLPAVETFEINACEKAFSVKTKKGIELQFPDEAFADGLGNPVVGKITISVQSFHSKTDFASAQLTSSTSSGDALISGGMIDIQAKSLNADLRLSDGKSFKIIGNSADNILDGVTGADTMIGGLGNDHLIGGGGADILNGGDGFDYAHYGAAASGVTVDMVNNVDNTGEAVGDFFASIEAVVGSNFNDSIRGNELVNWLYGGAGSDFIYGRGGNDYLLGGDGTDFLYGGTGTDVLYGEGGDDRFVFSNGGGIEYIMDFNVAGGDAILVDVATLGLTSFAQLQARMVRSGNDTIIGANGDSIIVLLGVTPDQLTASEFIFG